MEPDCTDGSTGTGSAIVVPVPEAEPVVARHRARLDSAAGVGIPAHVTVLAPFLPPKLITGPVIATLARVTGSVRAFDCTFGRTAWFGDRVLWLAPEPDAPFRELTQLLTAAFPGYPPYGGAFADVIPHLTVGDRESASEAALRAGEAEVASLLPVRARVSRAWLMTGTAEPGGWHRVAELPLSPAGPATGQRG